MKRRQRKRQRPSERKRKDDKDRLSDLPDGVLLHIMHFMNTKNAVRTCVLSKRWKDLWKGLSHFVLHSKDFISLSRFKIFVYWALIRRDQPFNMHSLDFSRHGCIDRTFLYLLMRCAMQHKVQSLTLNINLVNDFELLHCIFKCQSLTFLKISVQSITRMMVRCPKSLGLMALKTLHLSNVNFTETYNDCADPFSNCKVLNTLVIDHCVLRRGTRVLRISNATLSSLTILDTLEPAHKIDLDTPNLCSLTIRTDPIHQLSTCNLPFLDELNITCRYTNMPNDPFIFTWLQLLGTNVRIMTLCSRTIEIINNLSTNDSTKIQPPCFARLKALKVYRYQYTRLSSEGMRRAVAYLLQNSPKPKVDIIYDKK
ncbi:hypothetical protein Lal_00019490 [Lupinus albus]|uniref:Putative F-box domain, leucine-rich repeat domain, L domain-containing protein n=1 Tax=Lupinus albus TaxID=3870 RepID=A0A6A5PQY4_LUPAL|nr:putative F-box domain, leucine-rich repeat domain, L domain-containing protein [Lupinus albus]KAF1899362.1 hypothetical protein Lal_00019490 [Lupinus albus]